MSALRDMEAWVNGELRWRRLEVRALADIYRKLLAQNAIDLGEGDPAEHGAVLLDDSVAKEVLAVEEAMESRGPDAVERFRRKLQEAKNRPFVSTDRSPRIKRDEHGKPVIKDQHGRKLADFDPRGGDHFV